jgi:LPS-assembly lipoprotein
MPLQRAVMSILLLLTLGACGFQMRGARQDALLPFTTMHLELPRSSLLTREMRTAILAQGNTVLTDDAKSAQATLRILSESNEKKVLTLNAQGQVREFSLLYRISFDVKEPNGNVLLSSTELALQQIMTYSESAALAKELEERLIYSDLRSDAISQILRRLGHLKSTTTMSPAP